MDTIDNTTGLRTPIKSTDGALHVAVVSGGGGGGGGAGSDRELVVTTYVAKNAFTGASVGDTITATQIIDVTSTPSTVSTIWRNQTTAADLGSTPSAANLTLVGSSVATETTLSAQNTLIGAVTETAPASDTASSGLNGRLQRIAQRLTSIFTALSDRSQKTQLTDGTNEATISTSTSDGVVDALNRLRVSSAPHGYNGATWDKLRAGRQVETGSPTGYLNVLQATGAVCGASTVSSTAQEASRVVKASAGTLMSLVGYNAKTTAQFIQIHNTTSVPADTAVPVYSVVVPATSPFEIPMPNCGAPFTTGISVCNSSTQATKTVGSADCWFTAVIK